MSALVYSTPPYIAVLLLALSLVLVHEGWQALRRKGRPATEKV